MSSMPAARVGDDVAHSNAMSGLMKGLVIGVAVGVLVGATIATGGTALAVVAGVGAAGGLASAGGLAGAYIGGASMGPSTGKFVTGSPNVLVNGHPATMTLIATASCSKESGAPIPLATGSSSVFINARMAGREGETLGCSAASVKQTSPNVLIGGASAADPDVAITPEIPPGYITALQVVGVAGAIMALPFAIATVGVAATIGGGVLGFVGAKYGAQGGRALGEALGMSETGIRSLEVAGGFLGGMAGGVAGAKGGQVASYRGRQAFAAATGRPAPIPPPVSRAVRGMPKDFQDEYAAARAAGWKKPDGKPWYPPNNGGVGVPKPTRLSPNQKLDRFGDESGGFMSAAGDSFEQRALPGAPSGPANKYTTAIGRDGRGLTVEESPIAPWFDQPGGGTQYRLVDPSGKGARYSVEKAVNDRYLTRGH